MKINELKKELEALFEKFEVGSSFGTSNEVMAQYMVESLQNLSATKKIIESWQPKEEGEKISTPQAVKIALELYKQIAIETIGKDPNDLTQLSLEAIEMEDGRKWKVTFSYLDKKQKNDLFEGRHVASVTINAYTGNLIAISH